MTLYHFDTLPIHPQPEPLESLSSYLTRLAEANGLRRRQNLFRLCFPTEHYRSTYLTGDFPPPSFGYLASLAHCPEPALLATTFYHLACKFDRSPNPTALAQCLSGSLSPHLRYCPSCLHERGYYPLIWRFLSLTGCPEHRCYLLDGCGHCGQRIPLLPSTPKLGYCPACGGDLRRSQTKQIEPSRLAQVSNRSQDLVYLVQPQPGEWAQAGLTQVIGQRFSQWRQIRRLKISHIASILEVSPATIYYLEEGTTHRTTKLRWYLEYAAVLGVSLRDIFRSSAPKLSPQSPEQKVLTKIRDGVAIVKQQQKVITRRAVLDLIGIDNSSIFTMSPTIRAIWTEIKEQERDQSEQKLLDLAQQAIDHLRQQGQAVSLKAVANLISCSAETLHKSHPPVYELVLQHRDTPLGSRRPVPGRPKYRREAELMTRVQATIIALEREGVRLSQEAIAKRMGRTSTGLKCYPQIKILLQAYDGSPTRQDETILLKKVQTALAQLEANEAPITIKAVSQAVGFSASTLKYYPQVRAFLIEHILEKKQAHRTKQRQRREAELVKRVQQAIATVQAGDGRLTQRLICELVGMSSVGLKRYPQVKRLLGQLLHPDRVGPLWSE